MEKKRYPKVIHFVKMKYVNLSFYIILILPTYFLGQEYSLSGKVMDSTRVAIPYANVVLQDKDSVTVKWELTDEEGRYSFKNIKPASYILKVDILGYETEITQITVNEDISDYITILAQKIERLDEVVLQKPRVERRSDRLIFNVQNTTLSDGNTWNALTKTPYLLEIGNKILVQGQEEPLIFINDRRVHLSQEELRQLLESTPANTLKYIEVIVSPPAKYNAEGKAVVNISMSKPLSTGYNGNMSISYEQGVYPKLRFSTGHFYKKEKLNVYAGYTSNYRREYSFFRDRVNFFTDGIPSGSWLSKTRESIERTTHSINTNIDYTLNDKHSVGVSGYFSTIPNRNDFIGSDTEAIDSSFYSVNRGPYKRDNIAVDLNYRYKLGKGKRLTANMHHTVYDYDHDQTITTDYLDSDQTFIRNNAFTNDKEQRVEIYTGQLDYTSDTKKNGTFETGVRWSYITFDNEIDQVNIQGNTIDLYDRFLYDETTLAAYVGYEKSWKYWNMALGLRGENTSIEGISLSEEQTNTQDYFKLFPVVNLGYTPSDNHEFTFSYSRKISRPRYSKLNPFRLFLNDNAYVTGNPGLQPTIDNRFNFNYRLNRAFSFDFYLTRSIDPILQLPYVDNEENELVFRQENLDESTQYGMRASWNKNLAPWWYFSIFSSVFYDESVFFATQNDNEIRTINRWVTLIQGSNSFTLSKDRTFSGDLTLGYISKTLDGNTTDGNRSLVNISLQKTLWNKRATLTFEANDIFNQLAYTSETNYLDQQINSYSDFEYRTFELRFIYRFGNYRLKTNRKSIDNNEIDRL